MANTGATKDEYKRTVTHGDHVYICGGGQGFVNSASLNLGGGGIIKLKKSSGQYVNHIASTGSFSIGCSNMFSDGSQILITLYYGFCQVINNIFTATIFCS